MFPIHLRPQRAVLHHLKHLWLFAATHGKQASRCDACRASHRVFPVRHEQLGPCEQVDFSALKMACEDNKEGTPLTQRTSCDPSRSFGGTSTTCEHPPWFLHTVEPRKLHRCPHVEALMSLRCVTGERRRYAADEAGERLEIRHWGFLVKIENA